MHILTCLYGHPTDPEAFDAHFQNVHAPLAMKVIGLGLRRGTATRLVPLPDGTPPPYYVKVDLVADSAETLDAVLNSPEGQAAQADMANFATGGVTLLRGDVLDEAVPS
ncbi:EthD family reductase [Streptomyces sp. 8N616]|uniref:EthD family reductase n=1 Tax=Streptomyces sp. 8N616 TaxID=3457414 RepID=UPI003FCFF7E0